MRTYVKRVQTLLTEEEFAHLSGLSAKLKKPLSVLVRKAVEEVYFEKLRRERRKSALKSLLELESPVSDWPQMEREIAEGAHEK